MSSKTSDPFSGYKPQTELSFSKKAAHFLDWAAEKLPRQYVQYNIVVKVMNGYSHLPRLDSKEVLLLKGQMGSVKKYLKKNYNREFRSKKGVGIRATSDVLVNVVPDRVKAVAAAQDRLEAAVEIIDPNKIPNTPQMKPYKDYLQGDLKHYLAEMIKTKKFKFRTYDVTMIQWKGHWAMPLWFLGKCLGYSRDGGSLVDMVRRDRWKVHFPDQTVDPNDPCLIVETGEALAEYKRLTAGQPGLEEAAPTTRLSDGDQIPLPVSQTGSRADRSKHLVLITQKGLYRLAGMRGHKDMDKTDFLDWLGKLQADLQEMEQPTARQFNAFPMSRELAIDTLKYIAESLKNSREYQNIYLNVLVEMRKIATDPTWNGSTTDLEPTIQSTQDRQQTPITRESVPPATPPQLPPRTASGFAVYGESVPEHYKNYLSADSIRAEFAAHSVKYGTVNRLIANVTKRYRDIPPLPNVPIIELNVAKNIVPLRGGWDAIQANSEGVKICPGVQMAVTGEVYSFAVWTQSSNSNDIHGKNFYHPLICEEIREEIRKFILERGIKQRRKLERATREARH